MSRIPDGGLGSIMTQLAAVHNSALGTKIRIHHARFELG